MFFFICAKITFQQIPQAEIMRSLWGFYAYRIVFPLITTELLEFRIVLINLGSFSLFNKNLISKIQCLLTSSNFNAIFRLLTQSYNTLLYFHIICTKGI